MSKKLTTKEFILKANIVHNNKYNYSLVNYINSKSKVIIICPIHGEFEQTPRKHLIGQACSKCNQVNLQKKYNKEFIKNVQLIYNNKYDYSLVNYINNSTKIKIICPIHGIFNVSPSNHLNGSECKICSNKPITNIKKFKLKASKKHNNKFDYSLVNYINSKTKVKIICPIHGIFEQLPNNHLFGYGCGKCGKTKNYKQNDFILNATKTHHNKFDYSIVNYKNNRTKVKIICPIHGIFEQTPNNHLSKKGCKKCNESKGEKEISLFLINNKIIHNKQQKFENCKYKQKLKFDFYLPTHNICVEFDGKQHFKSIKYWGGEKDFIIRQKRDQIKNIYCKENNIKLLRIKYNENINEKLTTFFNENIKI